VRRRTAFNFSGSERVEVAVSCPQNVASRGTTWGPWRRRKRTHARPREQTSIVGAMPIPRLVKGWQWLSSSPLRAHTDNTERKADSTFAVTSRKPRVRRTAFNFSDCERVEVAVSCPQNRGCKPRDDLGPMETPQTDPRADPREQTSIVNAMPIPHLVKGWQWLSSSPLRAHTDNTERKADSTSAVTSRKPRVRRTAFNFSELFRTF
jgi:hypothetical protein